MVTQIDPQSGYQSNYAQKLANNFPEWTTIRQDTGSLGHQFLNAFGMGLQDVNEQLISNRRNLYIDTIEGRVRWEAYSTPVDQGITIANHVSPNLLLNGGLGKASIAHRAVPLEWTVTGAVRYTDDAYLGGASIYSDTGDTGAITQTVQGHFPSGATYIASAYVKNTDTYTGELAEAITISANEWDTTESDSTSIPNGTGGEWTRIQSAVTLTAPARSLSFTLTIPSSIEMKMSAPQLENNISAGVWGRSSIDNTHNDKFLPFRMIMVGPTGLEQERIDLQYTDTLHDFFEYALPTRAATTANTGDTIHTAAGSLHYEFDKSRWDTSYQIDGQNIELYNEAIPTEIIYDFTLLDRYIVNTSGTGEYGLLSEEGTYSRTVEALSVFQDYIYIIAKEVKSSVTYRTLKVASRFGLNNQLQILADVDIGMTTGTVNSIGFIDGRMDKLIIELSDGTPYVVQLYFDYFYYDHSRRMALVRHPYTDMTPNIIET